MYRVLTDKYDRIITIKLAKNRQKYYQKWLKVHKTHCIIIYEMQYTFLTEVWLLRIAYKLK